MKARRGISIVLCLILFIGTSLSVILVSSANVTLADNNVSDIVSDNVSGSRTKVAETDKIALYYAIDDADNYEIIVEDKRNGYIWSSSFDLEKYSNEKLNNLIISRMKALFDFKYTYTTNRKFTIVSIDYVSHKPEVSIKLTKNGINMLYEFDKLGISIPLKISINENMLIVNIPVEEIKEEGDYHLTSLDLLPFFGASDNKEQGYMFYPDGSGALFRFKNEPINDISRSGFYIYGTDQVNLSLYEENERKGIETAMLPVYGVKKGENAAFLAVITDGEYDTSINIAPSGFSNIHLNRISPEFTYRRKYGDLRDNPNIPDRIETEILMENREVKYFFLANDEADYSGMANTYRNYLIEEEILSRKINENSKIIPMSLDLFMGINEQRILFDKFIQATTFKQSKTILEEVSQLGVDNVHVKLIGWGAKGYGAYPVFLPANKKLGGVKGLKDLVKYTKEKGYLLYLDANFTDANKGEKGFSIRRDAVFEKNGLVASNKHKDKYLLNPITALDRFKNQFILKVKEYGIDGLCLERIGNQLYNDYHEKYPVTRKETAENWQEMLEMADAHLGNCAANGGNMYILNQVNRLFDIPTEDSGNMNTSEAIPFYQMVVHGYIPYSSDPGNLFYDYKTQKLKWIEYGCMPYFKLTYSKSDVLKYTDYNVLFSSYYKDWLATAADTYKEFNEHLGDTWSREMIKHEQLQGNVYKVTYKDGTKIYVNYNQRNILVEGYEVKAVDYLVVDKGGNMR
ncbi:MAG TPA: DUF5696 domain-containing protein [Clostridiales bacterium]|nr:DUF5696 domain-containing protein [Clostridiales bacterium]